jgi:hypothetical protein
MAMKKNNRDYIAQMNKGMKQKLSMLLIACLLFTGYHGLTISGRAEQEEKEQTNEISVSGTQVKVQLLGEDIRRAAKEAIEKGDRVEAAALQGYSGDEDLQKEYAEIFSSEKEVYEIPLDSISEGLSESLAEEEAGLQVFVERDAKDLERLVRKESKESLLLYDKNSQLSQLFPETKQEEAKSAIEKEQESGAEEALASDSNIEKTERNTELTGSELITFLYKNKADHRISFQLSVDGNTYPKVVVSPKTQLFKSFLDKLKKEEKKPQAETTVVESTEAKASTVAESTETEATASAEETEESESESAASSVGLVSTEGSVEETTVAETTVVETAEAESAEESAETKEHTTEVTEETEATEETVAERKATETVKEKKENFTGFLQEVISHYEEFLGELETARFAQYSLNELGRKTQNVEIKDFVTVEVFYDEDAFDEDVVLEAKRLVKPEEEGEKEGEKLTEEQIKAMKEQDIYNNSDALDIRFVSKKDQKEVEPKDNNRVTVRLTFDKKAVPEGASADTIAIHHLLESKESGVVELVETVLRSETEKKQETLEEDEKQEETEELPLDEDTKEENLQKEGNAQKEEKITKEFTVDSFSPFIITWVDGKLYHGIRFYYVDREGREIGPVRYYRLTDTGQQIEDKKHSEYTFYTSQNYYNDMKPADIDSRIKYSPDGYKLDGLYGISNKTPGALYNGIGYGIFVYKLTNQKFEWGYRTGKVGYIPFDKDCAYQDFVFVYTLCQNQKNNPHPDESTVDLRNEKYITDNQDGTYELTLTGQIDRKKDSNKQPLDIVFVYDNTDIMATNFDFDGTTSDTEGNYVNAADRKSTEVKAQIKSFMDKMSASSSLYDVRYALVTMDGSKENVYNKEYLQDYLRDYITPKKEMYYSTLDQKWVLGDVYKDNNYPSYKYAKGDINLVGEFQGKKDRKKAWLAEAQDNEAGGRRQRSTDFDIIDGEDDDTGLVHKFTANPKDILTYLGQLNEGKTTVKHISGRKYSEKISGENYAAAIANVKALLHNEDASIKANTFATGASVRDNARKVVIFIAGGDAKYSYIKSEYQYDDVLRFDGDKYYKFRAWYKKGNSIGNGRAIDFAALNQARGELHELKNIDAFYSIGVGKEDNWKYLNDFAMGQLYDEDDKPKKDIKEDDKKKYREKALVNGVSYKNYNGSTKDKLQSSFDDIFNRVAGAKVKNIVIRDVLTKNVQLVPQNNTAVEGQLVKMKSNGVEVEEILDSGAMAKLGLNGFNITAEETTVTGYSGKRWVLTLKTKPEDFELPAGYDIRMIAKIEATDYAKKNSNFADEGMERTDLNDIHQTYLKKAYHEDGKPDSMFNSSARKVGVFTNEVADITYKTRKPNGSEETPPPKKYNKPIISLGNLLFEKTFEGIEEKDFFKASTGFTELGKKVLKQINFKIYRDLNGVEEPLLTINLGDDEIIKQLGKGPFEYHGYILEFTKGTGSKVSLTMKGMPLYRNYRVEEEVLEPEKELRESETAAIGYKFDKKLHDPSSTETTHLIVAGMNYHFKNKYVPVQPQEKTILIKKIVNEFGGTAFSSQARGDVFDFYMALYNGTEAYDSTKTSTFFNNLSSEIKDKTQGTTKIKVKEQDGSIKEQWVIHFHLQHDTSLSLPMDPNVNFRLFELKKDEYEKANIDGEWNGQKKDFTMPTLMEIDTATKYSYTDILSNMGQTITFKNPRITVVPTGLRGDLTPYLFSIFGFTLMAGAYFAINKKKRREI